MSVQFSDLDPIAILQRYYDPNPGFAMDPKVVENRCVAHLSREEGGTPVLSIAKITCQLLGILYLDKSNKVPVKPAFGEKIAHCVNRLVQRIEPVFSNRGGEAALQAMMDADLPDHAATVTESDFLRYVRHAVQSAYLRVQLEEEKG